MSVNNESALDATTSTTTPVCPPRVLLVDDNDAILERATATLAATCRVVAKANDGKSALLAVEALRPDVVVLDISMDGMSGLEVARQLRASGSHVSIIFLTVHDDEEFVQAALATGAIGYVVKARLTADLGVAVNEARAGRPFVSQL